MNRRKFLDKSLECLAAGLFVPGCVKEVVDSKPQQNVSSQLQKFFSLVVYTDVKSQDFSSAYIYAPIDKAKSLLEEKSFKIISLEENALLRILGGKDTIISKFGNFTREGFVYLPNKKVYLVRNSPVLDYPEMAASAHKKGKEFDIENWQIEKALEDSMRIPYDLKPIPVTSFGEEKITTFVFGKQAKAYGEFLKESGVENMPIPLVVESYVEKRGEAFIGKKAFVRQSWLSRLKCRSGISGDFKYLGMCPRVRGIKKFSIL